MIDWNTLIKPGNDSQAAQNADNCREKPGSVGTSKAACREAESNYSCDSSVFSSDIPTFPTAFEGGGKEKENHAPGEGVASDNYCATKTHPINPIAVTLLLTCCNKATFTKEETIEAIINLQTIPQPEQVRSWAILCLKHGINPHQVIHPFIRSSNKGTGCQGCKHIEMQKIATDKRPVFRFTCKRQHPILEAFYVGERVLIAPESCGDYQPTA